MGLIDAFVSYKMHTAAKRIRNSQKAREDELEAS